MTGTTIFLSIMFLLMGFVFGFMVGTMINIDRKSEENKE